MLQPCSDGLHLSQCRVCLLQRSTAEAFSQCLACLLAQVRGPQTHNASGVSGAEVHELKAIRDALAAIAPTKAIWKLHPTDLKSLEERNVSLDIPASVMVTHFAPQNSLLGHPKLRAFLTQAGTNSFLEVSCSARDDLQEVRHPA